MQKWLLFSRSEAGRALCAARTRGPLVFSEELGRRHHAEGKALLRILLNLVACTPHQDGEAQRQPTDRKQRDSPVAELRKVHAGKSAQPHGMRLWQIAQVCSAVDETLVKAGLRDCEQDRYVVGV